MPFSCSVSTCKNTSTSVSSDSGITFHPFPRNERESLEWFMKCKRRDKKRPNASDKICSAHFQPSDFEKRESYVDNLAKTAAGPRLKMGATPTQSLPFQYIKPADARRRLPPGLAQQLSRSSISKGISRKQDGSSISGPSDRSYSLVPSQVTDGAASNSDNADERKSLSIYLEDDETVCLKDDSHCHNLLSGILTEENFMDITIITKSKQIKAHKAVLSQGSGYFKKIFTSEDFTSEEFDSQVKVNDIEYEDLNSLITFIYQGKISVKRENVLRIHEAAKTLEIPSLVKELDELKAHQQSLEATRNSISEIPHVAKSSSTPKFQRSVSLPASTSHKKDGEKRRISESKKLKKVVSALLFLY